MLTILNESNGRSTDYSRAQLAREARHAVKHALDSDGKVRAWHIRVVGPKVSLVADYLTPAGEARSLGVAI